MANVWVYKADGTLQCSTHGGIPVADMQKELDALVPGPVARGEKRQLCENAEQRCGHPTGQVNAYELTPLQLFVLFNGTAGPQGFRIWTCGWPDKGAKPDSLDHEVPFPLSEVLAAGTTEEARKAQAQVSKTGGDLPYPLRLVSRLLAEATSVEAAPVLVRELYGWTCRVYNTDDELTFDYMPHRVNIKLNHGRIVRIWFG